MAQLFYQQRKMYVVWTLLVLIVVFAFFKPQQFIRLWLTPDQQGQVLFSVGYYEQAAMQFNEPRWQAYSLYAIDQFEQSAALYNQFESIKDVFARANALSHGRHYVKARAVYQSILAREPKHQGARHNLLIIQKIIDEVNRISASQQAEEGDAPQELGDKPQTGDGAKKREGRKQKRVQLDAKQLLLDKALNEMWMRQVQKNPALFLSNKFYRQYEKNTGSADEVRERNE
ncbi:MAG: hypothetical protein JKY66_03605 [Spongiibacteraceae bacterium]|nr:hypothetical protein [Spongiibacteraceae bacterium]